MAIVVLQLLLPPLLLLPLLMFLLIIFWSKCLFILTKIENMFLYTPFIYIWYIRHYTNMCTPHTETVSDYFVCNMYVIYSHRIHSISVNFEHRIFNCVPTLGHSESICAFACVFGALLLLFLISLIAFRSMSKKHWGS